MWKVWDAKIPAYGPSICTPVENPIEQNVRPVNFRYRTVLETINSSNHGQHGWYYPDDIFKCIFMNEKFCILIRISLKFVPKGPIKNIPVLVHIMSPDRRQAIIWTNAGLVHWRIYAALGGDELRWYIFMTECVVCVSTVASILETSSWATRPNGKKIRMFLNNLPNQQYTRNDTWKTSWIILKLVSL